MSEPGRSFTFLTCTNAGAAKLNAARVRIEFPSIDDELQAGKGVRADPQQSGELHVFHVGMVVRLTKNLDKDRGFTNGALGVVRKVLHRHCLVVEGDFFVHQHVRPISPAHNRQTSHKLHSPSPATLNFFLQ